MGPAGRAAKHPDRRDHVQLCVEMRSPERSGSIPPTHGWPGSKKFGLIFPFSLFTSWTGATKSLGRGFYFASKEGVIKCDIVCIAK